MELNTRQEVLEDGGAQEDEKKREATSDPGERETVKAEAACPITDPGNPTTKELQIMVRCVCCWKK